MGRRMQEEARLKAEAAAKEAAEKEAKRLAEEARKKAEAEAEAKRKADEAARKAEEEAKRKEEEAKKAEEAAKKLAPGICSSFGMGLKKAVEPVKKAATSFHNALFSAVAKSAKSKKSKKPKAQAVNSMFGHLSKIKVGLDLNENVNTVLGKTSNLINNEAFRCAGKKCAHGDLDNKCQCICDDGYSGTHCDKKNYNALASGLFSGFFG